MKSRFVRLAVTVLGPVFGFYAGNRINGSNRTGLFRLDSRKAIFVFAAVISIASFLFGSRSSNYCADFYKSEVGTESSGMSSSEIRILRETEYKYTRTLICYFINPYCGRNRPSLGILNFYQLSEWIESLRFRSREDFTSRNQRIRGSPGRFFVEDEIVSIMEKERRRSNMCIYRGRFTVISDRIGNRVIGGKSEFATGSEPWHETNEGLFRVNFGSCLHSRRHGHRFGEGVASLKFLKTGLSEFDASTGIILSPLGSLGLFFREVGIESDDYEGDDGDCCSNPKIPMLSKGASRAFAGEIGILILILIGVFVGLIHFSQRAIDEHGAIISGKVGTAFGCLILTYPCVHAILDLLTFRCVYWEHLI